VAGFGLAGGCAFFSVPTVGIIGSTCVGIIDARSIGCVFIGPVVGLIFAMLDNALQPGWFELS
jgi:hypothetical protein